MSFLKYLVPGLAGSALVVGVAYAAAGNFKAFAPSEFRVHAADLVSDETAGDDAELIAAGKKAFNKCKACHQIGEGAENKTGPHLNGIFGRVAGSLEDFRGYSKGMKNAGAEGLVWDAETMTEFLTKPRTMIKGTKMSFAGYKKEGEIEAVLAYMAAEGGE